MSKLPKIRYRVTKLDLEIVRSRPDLIFVFGDNLIKKGKAGQAVIRDEPNALGIPTKRLPCMSDRCFFDDSEECFGYVKEAIDSLSKLLSSGKYTGAVLPVKGIGTGLACLPEKAPKLYRYLNYRLYKLEVGEEDGSDRNIYLE